MIATQLLGEKSMTHLMNNHYKIYYNNLDVSLMLILEFGLRVATVRILPNKHTSINVNRRVINTRMLNRCCYLVI